MLPKPTCSVDGCERPVLSRGFCVPHYHRIRKYGEPGSHPVRASTYEGRFWQKVNKNGPVPEHRPDLGPCWLWTGAKTKGYGTTFAHREGGSKYAHRIAYEWLVSIVSDDLDLDHLCRVRCCVNPTHLEPVSPYENFIRGENPTAQHARKTHCKRGHPFDDANTIRTVDKAGRVGRQCRICQRATKLRWERKQRAKNHDAPES